MKSVLIFVVLGTAVCFPSSGTEKAELKNVSQRKEFLAKAKKFIDELKTMFHKYVAIDNNNSMTVDKKHKAFSALEKENPKVYAALWGIHLQFMPVVNVAGMKEPMALAHPEMNEKEWKKEVRASVLKLISGLNAALKRRIDILDDKSKTSVEKLKSLAKLTRQNPRMDLVLEILIGEI